MFWIVSTFVLGLAIGVGWWWSHRPPLAERIQYAMDGALSSRVRKAKGLPSIVEFDFLFEVSDQSQAERLISDLSAIGFTVRIAESSPERQIIAAMISSSPAAINFASYRQQFSGLCCTPGAVYLGLGEASYGAAGINLPAVNEQHNASSPG